MDARNQMPRNVLQEYLSALAEPSNTGNDRQREVLLSYAELQYRLHGGGHCAVCHAAVRHVLPVRAEHADGTVAEYPCLCTRCLESERAQSTSVTLTVGSTVVAYEQPKRNDPPRARKFKAEDAR